MPRPFLLIAAVLAVAVALLPLAYLAVRTSEAGWPAIADELFTERIPFQETRDYVKILTRNHALYSGLYGEGS